MRIARFLLPFCGMLLATFVTISTAEAQATRTWVSGVGDDANPCSRTAPCKTFAGAISKTAAGGAISVLDPGGYGAVTITKSITIDGTGTLASILNTGTTGVIVNAAGAKVVLRNIDIDGGGTGGLRGVRFMQGASLTLENVAIRNQIQAPGVGVEFSPSGGGKLTMKDVSVVNNTTGVVLRPNAGGLITAALDDVLVTNNTDGIFVDGNAAGLIRLSTRDVTASNNTGAAIRVFSSGASIRAFIDGVYAMSNAQGVSADGAGILVWLSNSIIAANTNGVLQSAGASVISFQNNQIVNNTTNGTPLPANSFSSSR